MANDNWKTPPEVIKWVERRFGEIKIDLCSSDENKVCEINLTEIDDFLDDAWIKSGTVKLGEHCWCNPPYSNPLPFVKQCVKWGRHGYAVTMLLNLDTSTKWFELIAEKAAIICPIVGGRISFLDADGVAIKGNNKPQFIAYFSLFWKGRTMWDPVHISEIYGDR